MAGLRRRRARSRSPREASIAEKSRRGALPGLHSSHRESATVSGVPPAEVPRHGVAVPLAGRAVAGAEPLQVEPRVALQELDEMLAHHAGGAEDAYFDSRLHKLPDHLLIDFDGFEQLPFWARALRACGRRGWCPGPMRKGSPHCAAERGDVGGVRDHGCGMPSTAPRRSGGNLDDLAQLGAAFDRRWRAPPWSRRSRPPGGS